MIAVIFEVQIKDGKLAEYLDIANAIRGELDDLDGFISIERYQSLNDPDKYLSLSFWRDLESVDTWKKNRNHVSAQNTGREYLFKDYRISVCQSVRINNMKNKDEENHSF